MEDSTTIKSLLELRDSLKSSRDRYVKRLDEIEHQLNSVSETIALLGIKAEPSKRRPVNLNVRPGEMRGMTQLTAMIHIAQKNNGKLKVSPVKDLLVEAGLIKSAKNASNIIFTAIERSGRFERIKRGEYKLIPARLASASHSVDASVSEEEQKHPQLKIAR